jgi:subtilase family serine protease
MFRRSQAVLVLLFIAAGVLWAAPQDRITSEVTDSETVILKGNVSPLAQRQNDLGPLDPSTPLTGIRIMFKLSAAQDAALKQLLADQQNPASPSYHKWLTPKQYADRFGLSPHDITKVTQWLESQGFKVTEVAHGRAWVVFSGTAAQVQTTFHTELHRYLVNGETHFANSTPPSIPKAFAGVVSGLRGLNDFYPKPAIGSRKAVPIGHLLPGNPSFNFSGANFLAPDDLATIYDIANLYSQGYDGTGQTIAVVGQSGIHTTDLSSFWSFAGLTPPTVNQVVDPNTGNPGFTAAELEADLDLETVSGIARNATIYYVYGTSADDAAAYTIDNHTTIPALVVSESFGLCEQQVGAAYLDQQQTIAAFGNSEGVTWVASSGDTGAANCEPNNGTITSATTGEAVSEPASLPGVTGVGGAEFSADVGNQSTYWSSTNSSTGESALKYIGEMGWNDSDVTGTGPVLSPSLAASGGGASIHFTKQQAPFQVGPGVPNDNKRDVPDVAMAASANHDGYVIFCSNTSDNCPTGGGLVAVGGTSAATPLFSGILILLNHYLSKNGLQGNPPGLGNANTKLYQLAQSANSPFHDITTGSNIVPCTSGTPNCPATAPFEFGFSAGVGYDQVTGLGSVDADKFVTSWASVGTGKTPTSTALALSPSSGTVTAGTSVTLTATISPAPPTGETVTFTDATFGHLGTATTAAGGTAALTIQTGSGTGQIPGGTYNVVANYPGDTTLAASASAATPLNIEDFTLSPSTLNITVSAPGQNGSGTINFTLLGGLTGTPTFSCSGLPSESNCTFAAASATSETITIGTTAASWMHGDPLGRGNRIFYAVFLPGVMGLLLPIGRRKRKLRAMLALIAVLALLTLWMPACSSSNNGSGNHNPGTPTGNYPNVTVTATASGINHNITVNLTVQ